MFQTSCERETIPDFVIINRNRPVYVEPYQCEHPESHDEWIVFWNKDRLIVYKWTVGNFEHTKPSREPVI